MLCTGTVFGVCQGCIPHADNPQSTCGTGQVCGLAAPVSPILGIPTTCIAARSAELGELCEVNADCASNICNSVGFERGYCSSCDGTTACAGGTCRKPWTATTATGQIESPNTCSGGVHGDACASDGDCASSHCNGAVRKECADGRSCATRDDCPVDSNLTPGECTTVGVQGGSCE